MGKCWGYHPVSKSQFCQKVVVAPCDVNHRFVVMMTGYAYLKYFHYNRQTK